MSTSNPPLLLSLRTLSRRVPCAPRLITRLVKQALLNADFVIDRGLLFKATRVPEVRRILKAHTKWKT